MLIGSIHISGREAPSFFRSPFYKDHAYVRVYSETRQEDYFIDPSLYEYLGVGYVSGTP